MALPGSSSADFRGVRFAPSPTGRFHVGNLRTAWVSREWARALGQPWVVRFEDIDRPRVPVTAAGQQLADLRALGLEPDEILTQSQAMERHRSLFQRAVADGRVYPCFCTRKDVRDALEQSASAPHAPVAIYSGACRPPSPDSEIPLGEPLSLRSPGDRGVVLTEIAWRFRETDPSGKADFIVARAAPPLETGRPAKIASPDLSFIPAYHWACAIDDYDGAYALLVRAHDLSVAAAPQAAIRNWVARIEGRAEYAAPAIFHASLILQNDGSRLEKRTLGVTLPELEARGISSAELLARFRRSFDEGLLSQSIVTGSLFGEARETLRLADLGL